jgi:hypothetical protein
MSGQIVDASLIAVPRQRNTAARRKPIKEGHIPDEWKEKPARLRQKDCDARWTVRFTKAKPREDGSSPGEIKAGNRFSWTGGHHSQTGPGAIPEEPGEPLGA